MVIFLESPFFVYLRLKVFSDSKVLSSSSYDNFLIPYSQFSNSTSHQQTVSTVDVAIFISWFRYSITNYQIANSRNHNQ